ARPARSAPSAVSATPPSRPGRRATMGDARVRLRDRLATRVTLVSLTVAFVAVLIAGVVSLSLVRGAAQEQARSALARQADLVATAIDRGSTRQVAVQTLLRRQQVSVDVVGAGQPVPGYLTPADVSALTSGQDLSGVRTRANGTEVLVEGRPVSD